MACLLVIEMSKSKELLLRKIKNKPKTSYLEWNILDDEKLCLVDNKDKYSTHGYYGFVEYLEDGTIVLIYDSSFESFNSPKDLNKKLKELKLPTIDDGVSQAFSILSDVEHKR